MYGDSISENWRGTSGGLPYVRESDGTSRPDPDFPSADMRATFLEALGAQYRMGVMAIAGTLPLLSLFGWGLGSAKFSFLYCHTFLAKRQGAAANDTRISMNVKAAKVLALVGLPRCEQARTNQTWAMSSALLPLLASRVQTLLSITKRSSKKFSAFSTVRFQVITLGISGGAC